MGPYQSQTANKPEEQEEQEENPIPKINHPKFTNYTITKAKDAEEEVIEVALPIANENQYKRWVEKLKNAPTKSEINLFPRAHSYKKEGYCGSSGFTLIEYDNFPFVLVDEIANRSNLKQKYFDEPQLWYLIYTLLAAGTQFHTKGLKIGDIRPENIFINVNGQVKVEEDNYFKTFYEKQITYLAPEQMKDLQFAKTETIADSVKAEAFSVGLTCLDAGTLTHSTQFYLKNNKFDYAKLESRLTELREIGYNPLVSRVIENLCSLDPSKRCTCEELFNWLNPYEAAIVNLEPFQPSQLLVKLIPENKVYHLSQPSHPQSYYVPQQPRQSYKQQVIIEGRSPESERLKSLPPYHNQVIPEFKGEVIKIEKTERVSEERRIVNEERRIVNEERKYGNENQAKSKIDFDLSKIDEQLEMSRKMFPS